MKVRRWLVAGVLFGGLWVFVRGPDPAPRPVLATFLVGLAVGMPVAFVFRRLYDEELDLPRSIAALPYVVLYVLVFAKDVILSNFDVAYRVLAPRMPLEPQVILVPLRVETSLGITTIANSITVTPGTLTLDHDADRNALYVHAMDGGNLEGIVETIRTWEDYALRIFDEERSPEDPPPEVTVHPPDAPPEPGRDARHLESLADYRGSPGDGPESGDDSTGGDGSRSAEVAGDADDDRDRSWDGDDRTSGGVREEPGDDRSESRGGDDGGR